MNDRRIMRGKPLPQPHLNIHCRIAISRFGISEKTKIYDHFLALSKTNDEIISICKNSRFFVMMLVSRSNLPAMRQLLVDGELTFVVDQNRCEWLLNRTWSCPFTMPIKQTIACLELIYPPRRFKFSIQRQVSSSDDFVISDPELFSKLLDACQGINQLAIKFVLKTHFVSPYFLLALEKLGPELTSLAAPSAVLDLNTGVSVMNLDLFRCTGKWPGGDLFDHLVHHRVKHLDLKEVQFDAFKEALCFFKMQSASLEDAPCKSIPYVQKLSICVNYSELNGLVHLITAIKQTFKSLVFFNLQIVVSENFCSPNYSGELENLVSKLVEVASGFNFDYTNVQCTGEVEFLDLEDQNIVVPQLWSAANSKFERIDAKTMKIEVKNVDGFLVDSGNALLAQLQRSNFTLSVRLSVLDDFEANFSQDFDDYNLR